jgi:predicted TIM-barrel fold metal-dependent hydrolase
MGQLRMLNRRHLLHGIGAVGAAALAFRASGLFSSPAVARTAANFEVPRGACDCHVHILDPVHFPYAAERVYTPAAAMTDDLIELQQALHMDRVVVVQPSVYAANNSCMLDAARRLGRRARGVAVIDDTTTQTAIDEMAAAGVRGIRLNLHTTFRGEIGVEESKRSLDVAAEQIRNRAWHIQFYTRPKVIAALKNHIEQLPCPVVFDHFGGGRAVAGSNQPGFDAVLDLVRSGRAYVKVSAPYRISSKSPDFSDVVPLARALIAANPDRVVWGSDWPHPDSTLGRSLSEIVPPFSIDNGLVLNQMPKWAADHAIRMKILVTNPARLYGFEDI